MTSRHSKPIDFASYLLPLLSIFNKQLKNKTYGLLLLVFYLWSDTSSTEIYSKTLPDCSQWRIYNSIALAEGALIHFSN